MSAASEWKIKCGICGTVNDMDDRKCRKCGYDLDLYGKAILPNPPKPEPPKPEPPKPEPPKPEVISKPNKLLKSINLAGILGYALVLLSYVALFAILSQSNGIYFIDQMDRQRMLCYIWIILMPLAAALTDIGILRKKSLICSVIMAATGAIFILVENLIVGFDEWFSFYFPTEIYFRAIIFGVLLIAVGVFASVAVRKYKRAAKPSGGVLDVEISIENKYFKELCPAGIRKNIKISAICTDPQKLDQKSNE